MECPGEKKLGDYLRGALGAEEAALFERHFRECRACGSDLSSMTASASHLLSAPSPSPGEVTVPQGFPAFVDPIEIQARPSHQDQQDASRFPRLGARYEILERIARGSMGEVYRARDRELARDVALKVIRPESGHHDSLQHFRREVALASTITHPNVLRVYDLGQHDDLRFLSMQLVDGEDLAAVARRAGRLPTARAVRLFRQICEGVAAAHAGGVLHRDLKPHNVLVDAEDRVYVADFGLARPMYGPPSRQGRVVGTPAYMSPEQARGLDLDFRSDIYSLGVILFELVAGRVPFRGPTPEATMELRQSQPPPPLRTAAPHAPPELEKIVARCLQTDPANRYASVRDLVADLDAVVTPSTAPPSPSANNAPRAEASNAPRPDGPPAWPLAIGDVVDGKYRIERQLGSGGMGVVLEARHLKLGEPVALKFVRWEHADDGHAAERLMREAQATFRLRSEHSVRAMDVGQLPSGPIYIVMELLEGRDLKAVLKARSKLPEHDAVSYALQVCDALEDAHALGITHRDLKPGNLFLAKQPRGTTILKVLDFGLSKLDPDRFDAAPLTGRDKAVGTPRYMAPEQWRPGTVVDARADIWALGMILYEFLTGVVPNQSRPVAERQARLLAGAIESPRTLRPEVSQGVANVVLRCLRADPDGRWRSARRLATALREARPDVRAAARGVTITRSAVTQVEIEAARNARLAQAFAPEDAPAPPSRAAPMPPAPVGHEGTTLRGAPPPPPGLVLPRPPPQASDWDGDTATEVRPPLFSESDLVASPASPAPAAPAAARPRAAPLVATLPIAAPPASRAVPATVRSFEAQPDLMARVEATLAPVLARHVGQPPQIPAVEARRPTTLASPAHPMAGTLPIQATALAPVAPTEESLPPASLAPARRSRSVALTILIILGASATVVAVVVVALRALGYSRLLP